MLNLRLPLPHLISHKQNIIFNLKFNPYETP